VAALALRKDSGVARRAGSNLVGAPVRPRLETEAAAKFRIQNRKRQMPLASIKKTASPESTRLDFLQRKKRVWQCAFCRRGGRHSEHRRDTPVSGHGRHRFPCRQPRADQFPLCILGAERTARSQRRPTRQLLALTTISRARSNSCSYLRLSGLADFVQETTLVDPKPTFRRVGQRVQRLGWQLPFAGCTSIFSHEQLRLSSRGHQMLLAMRAHVPACVLPAGPSTPSGQRCPNQPSAVWLTRLRADAREKTGCSLQATSIRYGFALIPFDWRVRGSRRV
jgi:hypothetical protein